MEKPLIWTTKGNVPVDSLNYQTGWDICPPHYIKFVERYLDESGEVVKESAHVYDLKGVTAESIAGVI